MTDRVGKGGQTRERVNNRVFVMKPARMQLMKRLMREGAKLTSSIGQFILLALDPVLQGLGLAPGLLNARLHRLWRHIVRPL